MDFTDIMVVSSAHKELCEEPIHLAEMQDYPLICLGKGTKSYEFFSNFYQRFGLKLNPDIEAGTIHQILPMVVYDLGIGFLPENVGIEALEDGKIIKVPLIEKIPQRQICLVESKRTPLSIAANALKQFIDNYIETKLKDKA